MDNNKNNSSSNNKKPTSTSLFQSIFGATATTTTTNNRAASDGKDKQLGPTPRKTADDATTNPTTNKANPNKDGRTERQQQQDAIDGLLREMAAASVRVSQLLAVINPALDNSNHHLTQAQVDKCKSLKASLQQKLANLNNRRRELSATVGHVKLVQRQRNAIAKDSKSMVQSVKNVRKQEELAMEAEVELFEPDMYQQYQQAVASANNAVAEMRCVSSDVLRSTIGQKRHVLDQLEQLATRAAIVVPPSSEASPSSSSAAALSLKAVATRRGARFPVSRTEALRAHARARRREREGMATTTTTTSGGSGMTTRPAALVRSVSPGVSDHESLLPLNPLVVATSPDHTIRSLFGDLFVHSSHDDEPEIIPLTYFDTNRLDQV